MTGLRGATSRPARCSRSSARRRCTNIGMQPLLDAIVGYVPSPAERPFTASTPTARETRGSAIGRAPYAAFVWKTIADPFAGRITHVAGGLRHAQVGHDRAQPDPRRRRAARPPAGAAGQDADAGAGAEGRRHRRGRQAEGHAHRTTCSPTRTRRARSPRSRFPSRCSPTRSSRRPAATKTRSAPRCSACRKRTRPSATARDPQTHELLLAGPGPAAHRGHRREAEAPLRRRGAT